MELQPAIPGRPRNRFDPDLLVVHFRFSTLLRVAERGKPRTKNQWDKALDEYNLLDETVQLLCCDPGLRVHLERDSRRVGLSGEPLKDTTAVDVVTVVLAGITVALGLATGIKALIEFVQQGRQKRAEHFTSLRVRFKSDPRFAAITDILDRTISSDLGNRDDAIREIATVSFRDKRDYLGLFEEVALAVNSNLVPVAIADYMFGYYAIVCWECDEFWVNINKFNSNWTLFQDFYHQAKERSMTFDFNRADFRF